MFQGLHFVVFVVKARYKSARSYINKLSANCQIHLILDKFMKQKLLFFTKRNECNWENDQCNKNIAKLLYQCSCLYENVQNYIKFYTHCVFRNYPNKYRQVRNSSQLPFNWTTENVLFFSLTFFINNGTFRCLRVLQFKLVL